MYNLIRYSKVSSLSYVIFSSTILNLSDGFSFVPSKALRSSYPKSILRTSSFQLHASSTPKEEEEISSATEISKNNNLFDLNAIEVKSEASFFTLQESAQSEMDDHDYALFGDEDFDLDEDYDDDFEEDDDGEYNIDPGYEARIFSQYDQDDDEAVTEFNRDADLIETEREDRFFLSAARDEKCILVAVEDLKKTRRAKRSSNDDDYNENINLDDEIYFSMEESMTEMRELIKTAGLTLTAEVTQRLNEPVPRTYVGTGKLKEVEEVLHENKACTIVFDAELSPRQQKALENVFNKVLIQNDFLGSTNADVKVLDRTALILDIFAQHAKTREGKLQVDLALHEYRKPRLTKMWTHLERQSGAGGVGLRGPGESQLEIDKRLIRDRILVLQRKIDNVQKQRDLHRRGREKAGLPVLAVVGYTNAGKSTLLNYLTRAGVMAENMLFATLDPTTRKVKLPGYKTHPEVLLTDTVGFIQALPTQLIAAFRATLEEVNEADVLIHVIDVTHPCWQKQEQSVLQTLRDMDAGHKPMVRVFNKIDQLTPEQAEEWKYEAAGMNPMSVAVSAITGDGMQDFVAVVEDALSTLLVSIEVEIPFSKGEELNLIHEVGAVDIIDYRSTGTYVSCKVPEALANRLRPYYVNELEGGNSNSKAKTNGSLNTQDDEEEIDWVALGRGRHKKKS